MPTLETSEVAVLEDSMAAGSQLPDFTSEAYKDAYSRINAIVIEGEQEAHDNYIALGTLIPEQKDELARLARMELKHMKGFTSCGRNLGVEADLPFAKKFFAPLHGNFQAALAASLTCKVSPSPVTCRPLKQLHSRARSTVPRDTGCVLERSVRCDQPSEVCSRHARAAATADASSQELRRSSRNMPAASGSVILVLSRTSPSFKPFITIAPF